VALQNSTPKSLIVVFTDNGSKDLELEKEIIRQVIQYLRLFGSYFHVFSLANHAIKPSLLLPKMRKM
jgi:hypothetical protein